MMSIPKHLSHAIAKILHPASLKPLLLGSVIASTTTAAWAVPTISSQTPLPYSNSAATQTPIVVNFNESIDISSVDAQSFVVKGAFSGLHTGEFSVDNQQVTFIPTEAFRAGEQVTVLLSADITNTQSEPLAAAQTWEFAIAVSQLAGFFVDTRQQLGNGATVSTTLVDVDNDNDLDAIMDGAIWLNDGSGQFSVSPQSPVLGRYSYVDDIDNDGDIDIVVSHYDRDNHIWINDGLGNFTLIVQANSSQMTFIGLADLNGDGYSDMWGVNKSDDPSALSGDSSHIWLNQGDGSFAPTQDLDLVTAWIKFGDLDKDGDIDAILSPLYDSPSFDFLRIYLNDGAANFSLSPLTIGTPTTQDVLLGDIDNDQDLDIISLELDAPNKVWLNDGLGNFSLGQDDIGQMHTFGGDLVDVDGDNDLDMVIINEKVNGDPYSYPPKPALESRLWLNDGSGHFSSAEQYFGHYTLSHASFGDLDGDQDMDAFISTGKGWWDGGIVTESANHVWLNKSFVQVNDFSPAANSNSVSPTESIEVTFSKPIDPASINSDSVVITGSLSGLIAGQVSSADNRLSFQANQAFIVGETISITLTQAIIASDGSQMQKPYVWQFRVKTAPSASGTEQFVDSGQRFSEGAFGLAIADLNNDQHLDAWISDDNFSDTIWVNDGKGVFSSHPLIMPSNFMRLYEVRFTDLDLDGHVDAMLTDTPFPHQVTFPLFGDSALNFVDIEEHKFGTAGSLNEKDTGMSHDLGDLDGDGDLDMLFVDSDMQTIKVGVSFNDEGYLMSSSPVLSPYDGYIEAIKLGDLDSDGDLDAFMANSGDNNGNLVWLNDGTGNFESSGQTIGNRPSVDVALGDLNADGHLDVFVANAYGNAADTIENTVWFNDGSGQFYDSGQNLGGDAFSIEVDLADVDGDGDLDAWLNQDGDLSQLWLNDGQGFFTEAYAEGIGYLSPEAQEQALDEMDQALAEIDLALFDDNVPNEQKLALWDEALRIEEQRAQLGSFANSRALETRLADLDHDGDLDAFVIYDSIPARVWLNQQVAKDLLINEINYAIVAGGNASEFIELKNISDKTLDFSQTSYRLALMNANGEYTSIDLSGTISAGGYHVICSENSNFATCQQTMPADTLTDGMAAIQLLAGDTPIDTLSYGGTLADYHETLGTMPENPLESLQGLSRSTDSIDTDDNSADFSLRCITPGLANSLSASSDCFQVSISDAEITEGNTGSSLLSFDVSLNHPSHQSVTLDYSTADGTASSPADYSSKSGTITFPALNNTTQTVQIIIQADTEDEGDSESFTLDLTNLSTNATFASDSATGLINDDDSTTTLPVSPPSQPSQPTAINYAPTAEPDSVETLQGQSIVILPLDNDRDLNNDNLEIVVVSGAVNGQVSFDKKSITYTPAAGFTGTENLNYQIKDVHGSVASAEINISVNALLPALPIAADDKFSLEQDQSISIRVLANDSDNLSLASFTPTSHGDLTQQADVLLYTPHSGFVGQDSFSYQARDSYDRLVTAQVTMDVSASVAPPPVTPPVPINQAPIAKDDNVRLYAGENIEIDVLANDEDDGGQAKLSIVSHADSQMGLLTFNSAANTLTYQADADFIGTETLSYRIADNDGKTAEANIQISVIEPPNTPPIAKDDHATTDRYTPITLELLANDTDADQNVLTLSQIDTPAHGQLQQQDNLITYTPALDFVGTVELAYQVSDGKDTDSAMLQIQIENSCYQNRLPGFSLTKVQIEEQACFSHLAPQWFHQTDSDFSTLEIQTKPEHIHTEGNTFIAAIKQSLDAYGIYYFDGATNEWINDYYIEGNNFPSAAQHHTLSDVLTIVPPLDLLGAGQYDVITAYRHQPSGDFIVQDLGKPNRFMLGNASRLDYPALEEPKTHSQVWFEQQFCTGKYCGQNLKLAYNDVLNVRSLIHIPPHYQDKTADVLLLAIVNSTAGVQLYLWDGSIWQPQALALTMDKLAQLPTSKHIEALPEQIEQSIEAPNPVSGAAEFQLYSALLLDKTDDEGNQVGFELLYSPALNFSMQD